MRIDWTPLALAHLQSAYEYIAHDNEDAAERLLERVFEGVERLERFPNMGRPGRLEGTRELVIPKSPFVVPYRVGRNAIEVLGVFHAARKWPERL